MFSVVFDVLIEISKVYRHQNPTLMSLTFDVTALKCLDEVNANAN